MEDGEVFFEEIHQSEELAKEPSLLLDTIQDLEGLDLIVGPSGYGVELTHLKDLDIEELEDWYLTYILLLRKDDLKTASEEGNPGIMVYSAMTESVLQMKEEKFPVCFAPGVINLPTVPRFRKINNLDMGTVDKLASAFLAVENQSERRDIPYSETSFILLELGGGYNAGIAVEGGKVVDGIGGTMKGMGVLSSGEVDMEMIQLAKDWRKTDVFKGGINSLIGDKSLQDFLEDRESDEDCKIAWNRMVEDILKVVKSLKVSVQDPAEIILSGRLSRNEIFRNSIIDELEKIAPVKVLKSLDSAEDTKQAAQGYGMIGEGLAGGEYSELVKHLKINEASGTALDYVLHPTGKKAVEQMKRKVSFR